MLAEDTGSLRRYVKCNVLYIVASPWYVTAWQLEDEQMQKSVPPALEELVNKRLETLVADVARQHEVPQALVWHIVTSQMGERVQDKPPMSDIPRGGPLVV